MIPYDSHFGMYSNAIPHVHACTIIMAHRDSISSGYLRVADRHQGFDPECHSHLSKSRDGFNGQGTVLPCAKRFCGSKFHHG